MRSIHGEIYRHFEYACSINTEFNTHRELISKHLFFSAFYKRYMANLTQLRETTDSRLIYKLTNTKLRKEIILQNIKK